MIDKLGSRIIVSSIKWLWNKITKWTFWALLTSCSIVFVVFFILPYYIFSDTEFQTTDYIKDYVEIARNILMGLVPLFGFPLIVWGAETAYEQKETAKKSLQETENNNRRTQENKIYMDCVGHLSSDKETIRTASIHGFGELLGNLENDIKNLSDTDTRKQERINFQDKILNVLWSFMVEHSREVLKQKAKDETSQEYKEAKEKINSLYHPQFRFIMELLAKYRPYKKGEEENKFWRNKSWENIYLQEIDLSRAELEGSNLLYTNLNKANLWYANLSGAYLYEVDLMGARLIGTILDDAHLSCSDLNGANLSHTSLINTHFDIVALSNTNLRNANLCGTVFKDTILDEVNLKGAKYNNATKFPDGFDPTEHNMKNLDEPTEEAKQAEKSLESAE